MYVCVYVCVFVYLVWGVCIFDPRLVICLYKGLTSVMWIFNCAGGWGKVKSSYRGPLNTKEYFEEMGMML